MADVEKVDAGKSLAIQSAWGVAWKLLPLARKPLDATGVINEQAAVLARMPG